MQKRRVALLEKKLAEAEHKAEVELGPLTAALTACEAAREELTARAEAAEQRAAEREQGSLLLASQLAALEAASEEQKRQHASDGERLRELEENEAAAARVAALLEEEHRKRGGVDGDDAAALGRCNDALKRALAENEALESRLRSMQHKLDEVLVQ